MKWKKSGFLKNKKQRNIFLICAALAAVLVVSIGMCVRSCLYFDDTGAHVLDRYGILAAENRSGSAGEVLANKDSGASQPQQAQEAGTPAAIRAVTVSAQSLATDSTYLAQLTSLIEEGVIDTVIVDLKTENGYLTFNCSTQVVDTAALTLLYADQMTASVQALKSAGARIIGRVYCFMDNHATKTNTDLSVKYYESSNWLDYKNNRWLDPENSESVQYICDIVSAGVALGCDEFMLENFCYPTDGNLEAAGYDESADGAQHTGVMESNLNSVQSAANGLPVGLYMNDVTKKNAMSGIVLSEVYDSVYRVCTSLSYEDQDGIDAVAELIREQTASSAKFTPFFTGSYGWSNVAGSAVLNTDSSSYAIYDLN